MRSVLALIRLGRPLFLGGGFILYALGALVALWHGHAIDWRRYAIGQAAVTSFQLMTHYANDYFDYDADRANTTPTKWSGGSRVLPAGELPRRVALIAAIVLALAGSATSLLLDGAYTLPTFALILVLAWEYSAPPLRLCATGLGELDTAIVVTVLVPWIAFYLQAPDLVGLRTLVVRLGAAHAAKLYVAITIAAYAWLPIAYALGLPARVALAGALPIPIAAWRIARIADHRDPTAYERLTFFAVFLLVATSAAMVVAFVTLCMN